MKKYERGEPINSLDELWRHEIIWFDTGNHHHTVNKGWFQNWDIRLCAMYIMNGWLFKANIRKEWLDKEPRKETDDEW